MAVAGSCSTSKLDVFDAVGRLFQSLIEFSWVSSAGGAVTEVGASPLITGTIEAVDFIPDSGDTQPSALYDVTLLDANGADVLIGIGANLPNDKTLSTNFRMPKNTDGGKKFLHNASVIPAISNAGAAKAGKIRLYIR